MVETLFAAVVTAATVVYAGLTWSLVSETKRLRQAGTDPNVAVYLEVPDLHQFVMQIVVRNIGQGPAYNVSFEFDRDIRDITDVELKDVAFFKLIPYFPPDSSFRTFLGTTINLLGDAPIDPVAVVARYSNARGVAFIESFALDPQLFRGIIVAGDHPARPISEPLKKIADELKRIRTNGERNAQP